MTKQSSELRRDAHHGGWILLSFQKEREQLLSVPRDEWPKQPLDALCDIGSSGAKVVWSKTATLPDGSKKTINVLANPFPLYKVEGMEDRQGRGMYDLMRGVGAHEIIVESEKHDDKLTTITPHHYALTLQVLNERIMDLRQDKRLHSFSFFREWICGTDAINLHPHSQLIASAILPLGLKNELDAAQEYFEYKERCLFCDMIRQESADGLRVVMETDDYITYCPCASRHPFEVHLFPKHHQADFCEEPMNQSPNLAAVIRDIAVRLEQSIPGWHVLMALHTMPVFDKPHKMHNPTRDEYHWHIEFLPMPPGYMDWFARTGTFVEHTPPERAAEYLKSLVVSDPWG